MRPGWLGLLQGAIFILPAAPPCPLAAQISIRCWSSGQVVIEPCKAPASAPAPPLPAERIQLPARIDTKSASALFTPAGQLYVRIARAGA